MAGPSGPAFLFNFYPRSPCGERQFYRRWTHHQSEFLSTLSLRRATPGKVKVVEPGFVFLSTLSLRRATLLLVSLICLPPDFYPRSPCGERLHFDNYNLHCVEISIHALLAESDSFSAGRESDRAEFLSTLSLRRATIDDLIS